MRSIEITKLRRSLAGTLEEVARGGESFSITRHGRPIAEINPPTRSKKPEIDEKKIAAFCKKHRVKGLALFGSILTDRFGPESDVDVLLDIEPDGKKPILPMVEDLMDLFPGRRVDFLTRDAVERMSSDVRRNEILNTAKVVYASS